MFEGVNWEDLKAGREQYIAEGVLEFVEYHGRARDSYGDAYEGDYDSAYLVFSLNGEYYKKQAYESSFYANDVSFYDDEPVRVTQHTKTVYYYE